MLNKLFSALMVLLLVGFSSCTQAQTAQTSKNTKTSKMSKSLENVTVDRQKASIVQKDDFFFIVLENEPNTNYIDTNLDSPFKKDKLKVIVSGEKLPIPPNVRMIGNPFKVTMIEVDGGVIIDTEFPEREEAFSAKGIVKKKGDTFVIETTETIYVPKKLAEDFQKEGKAVTFTAKKLPIPPYVRMIGQPIEIVTIESTPMQNKQLKGGISTPTRTKIK